MKFLIISLRLCCSEKMVIFFIVAIGSFLLYLSAGNIYYKEKDISVKIYSFTVPLKPNTRYTCVVLSIYTGDTFKCRLDGGKEIKVRLIGINTLENNRNGKVYKILERSNMDIETMIQTGNNAKEFIKGILKRGTRVILETGIQPTDKYGNVLAYVYLSDGKMLNILLIKEGYAAIYIIPPNIKYSSEFKKAQKFAIKERKGFWSQGLKVK